MKNQFSLRQGLGEETSSPDKGFENPDMLYAPHAFWFWNGFEELADPEAATCQVDGMSAKRFNPGYAHARFWKSKVPFWQSENWFKSFEASLAHAERNGSFMSYTMGDPSFPDKYLIPDHEHRPNSCYGIPDMPECPELKAQCLEGTKLEVEGGAEAAVPACLFAVASKLDASGKILSSTTSVIGEGSAFKWTAPANGKWRVHAFSKYCDWHRTSGGQNINYLDKRIAKPWLHVENDAYEKRFSRHFGKTMRGVFFDLEGSYGSKLVWSDDLPRDFKKLKGADVRLTLPMLLEEDAEGLWPKARWDWFDVVTKLYIACLFEPLDKWCRERGMFMLCHFWEEELFKQAAQVGSYMEMQRSYSMPGIDALFMSILDPAISKETESVSEFEGRQFMCEALGVVGWQLSSSDLKKAMNAAVAFGMTHVILHGVNVNKSIMAVSYPPDFYRWNPYWAGFDAITDFTRRGCYVNDHGRRAADVLLLCPMDSVFPMMGDGYFDRSKPYHEDLEKNLSDFAGASEIVKIDKAYRQAIRDMAGAGVEHLIADSFYLAKCSVEKGGELKLGDYSFKSVVLPPLNLLPLEAMKRLAEFAKAGGRIFAMGSLPSASAEKGLNDPELAKLVAAVKSSKGFVQADGSVKALLGKPGLKPCVSFKKGEFPLLVAKRIIDGRLFYWLANNGDEKRDFVLRFEGAKGRASLWNSETGERKDVSSKDSAKGAEIALSLESCEAFWIVFDPAKEPLAKAKTAKRKELLTLDGEWEVSIALEGQPDPAQHKLAAPEWLLKGGAKRPLESWLKWDLRQFTGLVDYCKDFELKKPSGDEVLELGALKHVAFVEVNGKKAGVRLWTPYSFEIGKLLKPGVNRVRIRVGNLILNALTQYESYRWPWKKKPEDAALDSGLFGPVKIVKGGR